MSDFHIRQGDSPPPALCELRAWQGEHPIELGEVRLVRLRITRTHTDVVFDGEVEAERPKPGSMGAWTVNVSEHMPEGYSEELAVYDWSLTADFDAGNDQGLVIDGAGKIEIVEPL